MNTRCAFRTTALILFFFSAFTNSPADIHADTTNARSPAYHPENRLYVDLKEFKSIHIPANPDQAEKDMARMLQKRMASLYKVTMKVKTGLPDKKEASILVGREHALSSGIVAKEELNSVKLDGYVIRGAGNRIVIAGYAPQGTIYGSYAFLRQIGLKIYPWHYSPDDSLEVFTPLKDGVLSSFSISSKPYFEYRDMLDHLDRGRFGGTILQYTLGDLRFAQEYEDFKKSGYLNWDHTAGYLVPLRPYYDRHPEFFANKNGIRIPRSTRNHNVALCMCNSDLDRISTKRLLEWMEIQKDRKYFAVTDGDVSDPQCPQCVSTDPIPAYYTDRLLKWVNTLAVATRAKHPDKILLTAAYQKTVKPPLETVLQPNVLIMYAPWYWTSRATSAVGFAHPLNIVAMEEFMGWSVMFPGQIGVYEYPGAWTHGSAERIKFYAKNRVRWLHYNAPQGNLLHWVGSQLLWDPFLDIAELESEFVRAFYGPAADVMTSYLQLLEETINGKSWHSMQFFRDPAARKQTQDMLYKAAAIAENEDLGTQIRILEGVTEGLFTLLKSAHSMQADPNTMRSDFRHLVELNLRLLGNCERLHFHTSQVDARRRILRLYLEELGVTLPDKFWLPDSRANQRELLERSLSEYDRTLSKSFPSLKQSRNARRNPIGISFSAPDETKHWRFGSSRADIASIPAVSSLEEPLSGNLRGVKISAPMSRLPVLPKGNLKPHAGRFFAARRFNPPLDAGENRFLDIHLHASRDVPVTIYIDRNKKLRSDVVLHAGEQIVRIDLRNYEENLIDYFRRDNRIQSIGFDIWPQDNFYPYPEVRDTDIMFIGVEANDSDPDPDTLPHKGKAIWLSQFRANVPHDTSVFRDLFSGYRQLMMQDSRFRFPVRDDFSDWKKEKFRTFTEYRIVSPIRAILTGGQTADKTGEAARIMQKFLFESFGVELPINPPRVVATAHTGNAIILGYAAAKTTGRTQPGQYRYVDPEGFIIDARNGRIIISGNDAGGTLHGAVRYLEDHGIRFPIPGIRAQLPGMRGGFLHELFLLDRPFFRNSRIGCGDLLATPSTDGPSKVIVPPTDNNITKARLVAGRIRDFARSGANEIPREAYSDAEKSPLSCYVASKLLWDPFADTSRLIREFMH